MAEFTASENVYDVIVVGLGGHGSATLAALAKESPSLRILGIEQFNVAHANGNVLPNKYHTSFVSQTFTICQDLPTVDREFTGKPTLSILHVIICLSNV